MYISYIRAKYFHHVDLHNVIYISYIHAKYCHNVDLRSDVYLTQEQLRVDLRFDLYLTKQQLRRDKRTNYECTCNLYLCYDRQSVRAELLCVWTRPFF